MQAHINYSINEVFFFPCQEFLHAPLFNRRHGCFGGIIMEKHESSNKLKNNIMKLKVKTYYLFIVF